MTEPSVSTREAMYRGISSKVPVVLLEAPPPANDPSASDSRWPLRLAEHPTDVTHDGDVYTAVGMSVRLPSEVAEEVGRIRVALPGAGEELSDLIRLLAGPPTVVIKLVTLDTTTGTTQNVADREWSDFKIREVSGQFGLVFTLWRNDLVDSLYPKDRYDGELFPGLV